MHSGNEQLYHGDVDAGSMSLDDCSDTMASDDSSDTTVLSDSSDTTSSEDSSDTTASDDSSDITASDDSSDTTASDDSSDTTASHDSSDTTVSDDSSDIENDLMHSGNDQLYHDDRHVGSTTTMDVNNVKISNEALSKEAFCDAATKSDSTAAAHTTAAAYTTAASHTMDVAHTTDGLNNVKIANEAFLEEAFCDAATKSDSTAAAHITPAAHTTAAAHTTPAAHTTAASHTMDVAHTTDGLNNVKIANEALLEETFCDAAIKSDSTATAHTTDALNNPKIANEAFSQEENLMQQSKHGSLTRNPQENTPLLSVPYLGLNLNSGNSDLLTGLEESGLVPFGSNDYIRDNSRQRNSDQIIKNKKNKWPPISQNETFGENSGSSKLSVHKQKLARELIKSGCTVEHSRPKSRRSPIVNKNTLFSTNERTREYLRSKDRKSLINNKFLGESSGTRITPFPITQNRSQYFNRGNIRNDLSDHNPDWRHSSTDLTLPLNWRNSSTDLRSLPKHNRNNCNETVLDTQRSSEYYQNQLSANKQRYGPNERNYQDISFKKPQNEFDKNQQYRYPIFGFVKLQELYKKEPHEIIGTIQDKRFGFLKTLEIDSLKPTWLVWILKIVHKICASDLSANKGVILGVLCNTPIVQHISTYVGDITTETDNWMLQNVGEFMQNLATFYKAVVDILPHTAYNKDFEKLIKKTIIAIGNIEQYLNITVDSSCVDTLNVTLMILGDYIKNKLENVKRSRFTESVPIITPPNSFRDISLYPTQDDIYGSCSFIRPNIIKGSYTSVEHYLDVQFRLLREDFVSPLREGLKKFISDIATGKPKFRYDNVRFYPKTSFVSNFVKEDKVGYIVNFDPNKKLTRLNWEFSKRFMFGSLLLFSTDNFNSFFMATVSDRPVESLKKGLLTISIVGNEKCMKGADSFLMAESEVYFEPYFRVMKSLQTFTERNFPMEKYIVKGDNNPDIPKYVIINPDCVIRDRVIGDRVFSVLNHEEWPSADLLGFDDYQYHAFKMALTREFTVIQGPPGTGKTFLGLKIAQVLLNRIYDETMKPPILLVCYTNHALDQFLEGILGYTSNIVRIGGQSHSEQLKHFNLRSRRVNEQRGTLAGMRDMRQDISKLYRSICKTQKEQSIVESMEGIVSIYSLKSVISSRHFSQFSNDDTFTKWLIDTSLFNVDTETVKQVMSLVEQQDNAQNEYIDEIEDNDDEIIDEDDVFNIEKSSLAPDVHYVITLKVLVDEIFQIRKELEKDVKPVNRKSYALYYNEQQALKYELRQKENIFIFVHEKLKSADVKHSSFDGRSAANLWTLTINQRWLLYGYWINMLQKFLLEKFEKKELVYRNKLLGYEEMKQLEDLHLLKRVDVVGMTTTGAARMQTLLRTLKPSVVIVEEAAEVLEAHIVVSLTKNCQHVILIGDHKQLKPSIAVYLLSKRYNFDVSLFERMINNGMECPHLNVQHRMRPEIAGLITPHIYDNLENHPSVHSYENIIGISTNLFFVNHNFYEEEVEETSSRKNIHEADFMIQLCSYLLLQGYEAEKITILTTYAGQMFQLRQAKRENAMLRDVKMIVVDKYQGEENDIILLSLVRSNKDGNVGFLKTENRVCVALSRAKKGLYIIGNMENLTRSSELWKKIETTLQQENAIGSHLTLVCQIHNKKTDVSKKEDFNSVQEGGCDVMCRSLLKCGHNCTRLCHVIDKTHEDYRCHEPCSRTCSDAGHACPLLCFRECGRCKIKVTRELKCGHSHTMHCYEDPRLFKCSVLVDVKLEMCGHDVKKPCYEDINDFRCTKQCEDRLECGHSCVNNCHKHDDPDHLNYACRKPCTKTNSGCKMEHPCTKQCYEDCGDCTVLVEQRLPCGHMLTLACSVDLSLIKCFKKCEGTNECGHKCNKFCNEDCEPCPEVVTKQIPECGHDMVVLCSETPIHVQCKQPCPRILSCTHLCKQKCGNDCDASKCEELVPSHVVPACGHREEARIRCNQRNTALSPDCDELLMNCQAKCNAILSCKDVCVGTCGKCWQGRLHVDCKQKCGNTLICGHSCNSPCRLVCPPCNQKCTFKCVHSKCPKNCGEPCVICEEKCPSYCRHTRCTQKCGYICDRKPCYLPCKKFLKCRHRCIGFCGEPCPPLCRICNEEEVTTIFFGYEDEPDSRFVLLVDCNHVIESRGLEKSLSLGNVDGEITMKVCPVCKTPILKTLRFMNYVKETYDDIIEIKKKIFGDVKQINKDKRELLKKLDELIIPKIPMYKNSGCKEIEIICKKISTILNGSKNRRHVAYQHELNAVTYIIDILFTNINTRLEHISLKISEENKLKIWKNISYIFKRIIQFNFKLSNQNTSDLNSEIRRYHRLIDLYIIEFMPEFISNKHVPNVVQTHARLKDIISHVGKYNIAEDYVVEQLLNDLRNITKSKSGLSADEKRQIHLAMSKNFIAGAASQGHWFKCRNGHPFCITECGGAMQRIKCPEKGCNCMIGGEHHRYTDDTLLYSEMDGARRPAWPSGAAM